MSEIGDLLTSYLFNALWQIAVIRIAGFAIARLLGRYGPAAEHKVWVCSLAVSVAGPMLAVCCVQFGDHRSSGALFTPTTAQAGSIATGNLHSHAAAIIMLPAFTRAFGFLYAVLLLFAVLRLGVSIYRIRKLVQLASPVALSSEKSAVWQSILPVTGSEPIRLLASHATAIPMTVSMPHPVIILPLSFVAESTLAEFTATVAHECAHINRRDCQKNIAYEMLLMVILFHPLSRAIRTSIARTREMICDSAVVCSVMDWQSYALALLEVACKIGAPERRVYTQALGVLGSTDFERRIQMLRKNRNVSRRVPGRIVFLAASLLAVVALFAGAWTRPLTAKTRVTDKPLKLNPALACTYYERGVSHDGTCGRDNVPHEYLCFLNENPMVSQLQAGCESKVLRAEKAHSRVPEKK